MICAKSANAGASWTFKQQRLFYHPYVIDVLSRRGSLPVKERDLDVPARAALGSARLERPRLVTTQHSLGRRILTEAIAIKTRQKSSRRRRIIFTWTQSFDGTRSTTASHTGGRRDMDPSGPVDAA